MERLCQRAESNILPDIPVSRLHTLIITTVTESKTYSQPEAVARKGY
jgi:hypothetical protein